MSQPVSKIPLKETNNYKQGNTGAGTMKKIGPAYSGGKKGNAGNGGAIVTPTKGLKTK